MNKAAIAVGGLAVVGTALYLRNKSLQKQSIAKAQPVRRKKKKKGFAGFLKRIERVGSKTLPIVASVASKAVVPVPDHQNFVGIRR